MRQAIETEVPFILEMMAALLMVWSSASCATLTSLSQNCLYN
jgi:hypothetical protein